ncbi:MAG: lipid A deacylase LpxR family protein, partial [Zavarzinia sp.]|nr:lipid A deacylase LpxR family protein [Zavarzinia sp.]
MKKTFGALAARVGTVLAALVPVLAAETALADSGDYRPPTLASRQKTFTTILENDKFNQTDKWYTSGGKLVVSLPEPQQKRYIISPLLDLNAWVFDQPGFNRWELAIGQNIYEPADESLKTPDPKDRPYAGWLYVSAAAVAENRGQQNILEVQFGVVGPWSLAKEFQDVTHNLIGSNKALGWDHQLSNEP